MRKSNIVNEEEEKRGNGCREWRDVRRQSKWGALMMLMHAVSFSSRLLPLTHTYKHSLSLFPLLSVL